VFADDIALYRVIRIRADYIHLQEDVNPALGKNFFHFSTNMCKLMLITRKRANSLPPHLGFSVTSTWATQLALTCHGFLILQIAATRHIDLLDFSTGAFIDMQTVPVH